MDITKDTVRYVADLARVGLTDEDLGNFTGQLDRILGYVNKLKAVDVSGLEPTS
ncbi:MAG: Asp-tRNA(Asn)/Glu-tRNA(Gln) amidotransferase subunit GatC, partial [Candidatus Omnitrophica bacterium]|nr:Asp-tRNA(Asn)/Glu-tRNA(Gln) amidotransferase subunit GatC [Candidatus Omnitrophota bacterium]